MRNVELQIILSAGSPVDAVADDLVQDLNHGGLRGAQQDIHVIIGICLALCKLPVLHTHYASKMLA
jgi:hypothetical protein